MKRCSRCKKTKDESDFAKDRSRKDGLSHWCKNCDRDYGRKKYRKKKGPHVRRYLRYHQRHRIVDGVKQKRCSACKKWWAESEFYKQRCQKDGLMGRCKSCSNKLTNKARQRREARMTAHTPRD